MKSLQIYQIKKDLVVSIRNKDIDAVNAATISNKLHQMSESEDRFPPLKSKENLVLN